jgi:TatA/E family protein of Tat protein translocase
MFGSLGFPELLMIFFVALIVFGPRRLPEIGRSIGKALGEFKKATNDMKLTLEEEVRMEEEQKRVTAVAAAPTLTVAPTPDPAPGDSTIQ